MPVVAAVKGVQISSSIDGPLWGDQGCKVQQIVCESGSEYEVTVLMKLWLLKASVDAELVRKYRMQRRVVTRVQTRWLSRLQNKN